jgi:hypothetical protein
MSFVDSPYVASPTWVDITQYVREISVKRGRQNDLQQFPSGSATLTLDNRTRLFDPFNTAGTYYGNLKPRRQIKIEGVYASVTYPVFRGFVAGFPVQYMQGGKDSIVEIDCFDALGLLASETTDSDLLTKYTQSLSPFDYWKCNDLAASVPTAIYAGTMANSVVPSRILNVTYPKAVADPLIETIAGKSALITYFAPTELEEVSGFTLSNASVAMWFKPSPISASGNPHVYVYLGTNFFDINYLASNEVSVSLRVVSSFASATLYANFASRIQLDGQAHHLVATWNGTTLKFYVDGVERTISVTAYALSGDGARNFVSVGECIIQEISTYTKALSATEIANLYQYSLLQIPETTTARENRIIATSSFPAALQSFPASPVATVSELSTGSTVTNELQKVVLSEGGELYVSKSGVLTATNREYFGATRSAVSQMTFTDTGTGVYYDYGSIKIQYDADQLRNSVEVQFSNGGSVVQADATSISSYGEAGDSRSTLVSDLVGSTTLATRLVNLFKNPKMSIEPFLVKGQRNPTYDWQRILGLELLDRFTFTRTPSTGSAVSQDMLLQSVEYKITPTTWETVINGSARYTGWFIIGVSLIGGTDVLL